MYSHVKKKETTSFNPKIYILEHNLRKFGFSPGLEIRYSQVKKKAVVEHHVTYYTMPFTEQKLSQNVEAVCEIFHALTEIKRVSRSQVLLIKQT